MEIIRTRWTWSSVSKNIWGPVAWNFLHKTAIEYSGSPTEVEARIVFWKIIDCISQIPCIECRRHSFDYVYEHPPDITNSRNLQIWVSDFHNDVNLRLGKPIYVISTGIKLPSV